MCDPACSNGGQCVQPNLCECVGTTGLSCIEDPSGNYSSLILIYVKAK